MNKEMPDYKEAITYLDKAINSGYEGSSCFRELAECYLYIGDLESADATLQNARDLGLNGSDMELMAGEISAKKGEVKDAKEYYMNSIELAKSESDPEVLLRAYIGLNNVITSEEKTEQSLSEAINVLDSALKDLSVGYQLQIIQSQVQNYIDAYQLAGNKSYLQNGIDLLQKSIANGYKDYNNYINLAYLFEQNGDFDQAKEILIDLTNNYPENYIAYKRLAYLEADIQSVTVASARDYTIFEQYYLAAKEKYEAAEGTGDIELDFLDQMYSEAKASGWLN
jgi:tetratricopeptide (TPR) repeat protein